jgi:hypothetical protein
MQRFALLIIAALLAGCAELEAQQGSAPWAYGNERFQECMRYASESYCRDDIYGHGG